MPDASHRWLSLSSDLLTAQIDPMGAQLSSLTDRAGRDLLWGGDPAVWAGRAPLLFPIVGELAGGSYRLGASTYRLPRHGFARGRLFSIERATSSTAVFRLSADDATFAVYPFHFELDVHVELTGPTLSVTAWVRNKGTADMPASIGYHPAFRWPLPFGQPRSSHFIEFETDEPAPVRRLDSAGLLTAELHRTPIVHRRLLLTDSLFQDNVVIFDRLRSRAVSYGSAEGPRIRVGFPDAPFMGLWTKPGADFICIEPWHGIADPSGFSGDFSDKPGIFVVAAGDALAANMTITLLPPEARPASAT